MPDQHSQEDRGETIKTIARAPLSIKTLKTSDDIRGHGSLWNWQGTRDSELDYFLHFAGERSGVLRPHVLVAYKGDTPEAMLIGRLEHARIPIQLGPLSLRSPRLRVLNFVYGALRGSTVRDVTGALVAEALRTLRTGEVDVLVFEPLAEDSPMRLTLNTWTYRLERGFYHAPQNHYRMQLPPNSQALYEMLSTKRRHSYLRVGRKLARDFSGDVHCQWHTQPSCTMYRDLEFIAQRSHQRSSGVGFQDTLQLRACWELAGSKGWLRVCILFLGGRPSAFWTGMAYSGVLWADYMAYDRQLASYSPGIYLVLRSFGNLSDHPENHGIREIDLGPGDSEIKSMLHSSLTQEGFVYVYARTPLGVARNLMFSLVFLADRSARTILRRLRLFAWLRRLRHKHAIRPRTTNSAQ